MTDAPQADPGQLIDIGTLASANIVRALGLDPKQVPVVKDAIVDEITAMSTHFTLAVADVQDSMQIELNKVKAAFKADKVAFEDEIDRVTSTHNYVQANWERIVAVLGAIFFLGALVGHFV